MHLFSGQRQILCWMSLVFIINLKVVSWKSAFQKMTGFVLSEHTWATMTPQTAVTPTPKAPMNPTCESSTPGIDQPSSSESGKSEGNCQFAWSIGHWQKKKFDPALIVAIMAWWGEKVLWPGWAGPAGTNNQDWVEVFFLPMPYLGLYAIAGFANAEVHFTRYTNCREKPFRQKTLL